VAGSRVRVDRLRTAGVSMAGAPGQHGGAPGQHGGAPGQHGGVPGQHGGPVPGDRAGGPMPGDLAGRPRLRRRWPLALAVGTVPAAALATLVLPAAGGLSAHWPWVALIAFRGVLAAATLGAAVPLALVTLLARRRRRVATVVGTLTAVAVVATLGQLVVLATRGYGPQHPGGPPPPGTLTVVVTNTDHAAADPARLAALYLGTGADVMAMPETGPGLAADVARRLAAAGRPVQVFGVAGQGLVAPTSLLVADRLGTYRQVGTDGADIGEVAARPDLPGEPWLFAVHPQAPVNPTLTRVWRGHTERATGLCTGRPDAVLAGDFNSTVDHPALRGLHGCSDVAQRAGAGAMATWPQGLAPFFGAPLDHVFATSGWRPAAAWVEPIVGSDHRALVTRLVPVH